MAGTGPNQFALPRYSYGVVERALASVFHADDDKVREGAFRGRLKHFGRLGLPGTGTGKGARILYSHEQIGQLLVALHMSEVGVEPTVTVKMIEQHRKELARWIAQARDAEALADPKGNHVFLTLQPRLMSGVWTGPGKSVFRTIPKIGMFRRFDFHLKDADDRPIRRENIAHSLDELHGVFCCVDLTVELGKLEEGLQPPR
jgi:hypothetical protein